MTTEASTRVLAVNCGSSSIKFALYDMGEQESRVISALCEGIGGQHGRFRLVDADGRVIIEHALGAPDHATAAARFLDWLVRHPCGWTVDAVGHRVVHGGVDYIEPQLITPKLETDLSRLGRLDPEHIAHELRVIAVMRNHYEHLPQFACFDTAFHRRMPKVAQMHPLPRVLFDEGVVRYGFHGLSYEYILHQLRLEAPEESDGRVIVAHLGGGASMAAILGGRSLDTTMGFMPNGGLMMGARSGDLSPGTLLYLLLEKGLSAREVNEMVNFRSGLLGVSGISADVRDLLAAEATRPEAAEALGLFCQTAKKTLASLTAVLGGVDTLVFTAGIGEASPVVRERICAGLDYLEIRLDPLRNAGNSPIISQDGSATKVRVIRTNEELQISRSVTRLVRAQRADSESTAACAGSSSK